jgi:hypothetical protein
MTRISAWIERRKVSGTGGTDAAVLFGVGVTTMKTLLLRRLDLAPPHAIPTRFIMAQGVFYEKLARTFLEEILSSPIKQMGMMQKHKNEISIYHNTDGIMAKGVVEFKHLSSRTPSSKVLPEHFAQIQQGMVVGPWSRVLLCEYKFFRVNTYGNDIREDWQKNETFEFFKRQPNQTPNFGSVGIYFRANISKEIAATDPAWCTRIRDLFNKQNPVKLGLLSRTDFTAVMDACDLSNELKPYALVHLAVDNNPNHDLLLFSVLCFRIAYVGMRLIRKSVNYEGEYLNLLVQFERLFKDKANNGLYGKAL